MKPSEQLRNAFISSYFRLNFIVASVEEGRSIPFSGHPAAFQRPFNDRVRFCPLKPPKAGPTDMLASPLNLKTSLIAASRRTVNCRLFESRPVRFQAKCHSFAILPFAFRSNEPDATPNRPKRSGIEGNWKQQGSQTRTKRGYRDT